MKILLVDDEPSLLMTLAALLRKQDYEVKPINSGEKALEIIQNENFDLLLTDIRMVPVDGVELLKKMQEVQPQTPVVMITAHGSVQTAVEAMKKGAFDYVTKPFNLDELFMTVKRALQHHSIVLENLSLRNKLEGKSHLGEIVAMSENMRNVCEMVERIAPTDVTVLVTGEPGTGKELIARAIHLHSDRSDKPFITVNCSQRPESVLESELFGIAKGSSSEGRVEKPGLFEAAEGGTLFVDEISAMPMGIQSKLFRALEDKQIKRADGTEFFGVDVRIVASSSVSLKEEAEKGLFNADLYHKIDIVPIAIDPLRDRRDDMFPLISYFIQQEKEGEQHDKPTIDQLALKVLKSYVWPGNVRELKDVVQRALASAGDSNIKRDDLPAEILESTRLDETDQLAETGRGESLKAFLRKKEKEYVANMVREMDGNKDKAAENLNISLAELNRKLEGK